MAETTELLGMLASETDRRSMRIIEGVEGLAQSGESDPECVEQLRVEAHGLKGAASVVGQPRLAELAMRIEDLLASRIESGTIEVDLAARIVPATSALREGAQAAAEGIGEPSAVGGALESLSD